MQNETPDEADRDLRTVRVAPFWEQNQPLLLIAAPDANDAEVLMVACRGFGIKTHVVQSGAAALIIYGRFAPDAVVIGAGLTDVTAQQLLAAIAEDDSADGGGGVGRRCPVLYVATEGADGPDGADEVLRKYDDVLSTAVFAALADRSGNPWSASEELAYGSLVMRPAAFEVIDAGRTVTLTLREFELLRVLLLAQGEAVTVERLKTEVWGVVEEEVRTNTVKVHMNRLRQKLTGPTKPVAVRGIGYVLKTTAQS